MTDFIIVGRGLAATTLIHAFQQNNISFQVIGKSDMSRCSQVAAGIWNPIVFKRLTKSWLADDLIPCLLEFYTACEKTTGSHFLTPRTIIRPFVEEQEKILWQKKSRNELDEYLDPKIYENSVQFPKCHIPEGFGLVQQCGNLDVKQFLSSSEQFFKSCIRDEIFIHEALEIEKEHVKYKDLQAKQIIFCEGYLIKNNPYFNWIPLKPAKGEILTVKIEDLGLKDQILNKSAFLMGIGDDIYRFGATYEWDDLDESPTAARLNELKEKFEEMIKSGYEVTSHEAGIRPSSSDRRPVIGPHPIHNHLHVFNGLGTKGVMLAPYFVKKFVNFYLQKEGLTPEVSVKRFYNLYEEKT